MEQDGHHRRMRGTVLEQMLPSARAGSVVSLHRARAVSGQARPQRQLQFHHFLAELQGCTAVGSSVLLCSFVE